MRLSQRVRECLRSMRNYNEMDMIRHKAVPQQRHGVKLRVLAQQLQVGGAIGVAGENDLSRISALRHMMQNVRDHHTG